ncbi:hypothetical protein NMY22_g9620 [Coprinellus aureogranulatus]|nr:hypothetical protein NMY22_g9620 [Coprinellus aureogranulatus]
MPGDDSPEIKKWSETCFTTEIPLSRVVRSLQKNPAAYQLARYESTQNNWILSRPSAGPGQSPSAVRVVHAFIVRWTNSLETGNFVPEGKTFPKGVSESSRKKEPNLGVNISVTLDCKQDGQFIDGLHVLEEWGRKKKEIKGEGKSRTSWNVPQEVAQQYRYTMTSRLFQHIRDPVTGSEPPAVSYSVHPWIQDACTENWVPNPHLVQFHHLTEDNVMIKLEDSEAQTLRPGDLVRVLFKIAFFSTASAWTMSFIPIQIMRVKMGDGFRSTITYERDGEEFDLPQLGQTLTPVGLSNTKQGAFDGTSDNIPDAAVIAPPRLSRRRSESWESLTPPSSPEDSDKEEMAGMDTDVTMHTCDDEAETLLEDLTRGITRNHPNGTASSKGKGRLVDSDDDTATELPSGKRRRDANTEEKKKRVVRPRNHKTCIRSDRMKSDGTFPIRFTMFRFGGPMWAIWVLSVEAEAKKEWVDLPPPHI